MADFFATGHIIDAILVLVAVEAIGMVVFFRRARVGDRVRALLFNLLAGASLLLAVRSALVDAGWIWIALCLAMSLLWHAADVRERLRLAPSSRPR